MNGDMQVNRTPNLICCAGDREALFETSERSIPNFMLGVFASIIYSPMSKPLFAYAATKAISYFSEKMFDKRSPAYLDQVKVRINQYWAHDPRVKAITILFMLLVSCISPIIGILIGTAAGLIDGIVARQNLIAHQSENNNPPNT